MLIDFTEVDKKEKSNFLKGMERINQIVKNIFDEVYFNSNGVGFNTESTLLKGRCVCKTNINEFIDIPDNTLIKINTRMLYECIKAGKTKITGYSTEDGLFVIYTTEETYNIGTYLPNEQLDLRQIRDINNKLVKNMNVDFLKEKFDNKEFITLDVEGYKCMISHKLFPSITKCETINANIFENGDGTFYMSLLGEVNERNKKDEIVFSMTMEYYYKFLQL